MKRLYAFTIFFLLAFIIQAQENQFYYKYKQKKYLKEVKDLVAINLKEIKSIEEFKASIQGQANIDKQTIKLFGDKTFLIQVLDDKKNINKNLFGIAKINDVYETTDENLDLFWNDEICLELNSGVSRSEIIKIMADYKLEIVSESNVAPFFILRLQNDVDLLSVANRIAELDIVLYCHPNFFSNSLKPQYMPVDPYFNKQFYLKNTGQRTRRGTSTVGADIKIETAWEFTKGSPSITIAILDDGLDLYHQDINASNIIPGYDYANGDANVQPIGTNAHGTCCTGIIAAKHNTFGIAGIAPECKIRMLKIFTDDGTGVNDGTLATAIDNAWTNGADVISNSWGYRSSDPNLFPSIKQAVLRAITQGRNGKGCIVVFAAGNWANRIVNNFGYVGFPAGIEEVITVGASNRNDFVANYSPNCMVSSDIYIDICAPSHHAYSSQISTEGFEVWSTDISGYAGYNAGTSDPNIGDPDGKYTSDFGGTSAACPQVSAAAALILSINPNLTFQQVANILTTSADKVGGYNYNAISSYPGLSIELGFGRMNVTSALQQLDPPLSYQFINEIGTTNNYGGLILDENKNDTIPSNSFRSLSEGSDHSVRTNELPFIPDWNQTSQTKKHMFWNLETSLYLLNYPFNADVFNTRVLKASFNNTAGNIIIKNSFEYSTLTNSTGFIELKDPWYYYKDDNDSWFQSDAFIQYSSPLTIQNNTTDSYGGVFLNQGGTGFTPPYYSVKVDAVQDIPLFTTGVPTGNGRTHKFYFQNWSAGSTATFQNANALETPIVFNQDGAIVSAKLKGTQLSSNPNGYNSNSQRKYVKTDNGYLHLVYESMFSVWYEVSPDNGVTWYIQNNGKPISSSGKQPAIDYSSFYDPNTQETYYQTAITWQESYGSSSSKIKVAYFTNFEGGLPGRMDWRDTKDVATVSGNYSATNCYPVICLAYGNFKIVYKNGSSGALLSSSGWVNSYGIYSITTPVNLTGTDSYSVNPSIAVNKTGTTTVRLVWEQIQDEYSSSIKYAVLVGSQISGSTTTISTSSGSPLNFSPSISIANNAPVVSWTGARNPGDGIDKRKAITTRGTNWGSFQVAGTDINFVNNNSALGTDERTVISWSEGTTNPVTKWMRREGIYYSTPRTLSNSGYQSQLCTGTNFQTMSAMVFKNYETSHNSPPNYFLKSTTDFSTLEEEGEPGLNKITENDTMVTFGRSGVASINDVEFVFEIGDILVGDSIIKFIEIPDTISYSSTNELNEHTRTSNFTLTPSINLYFSNIYYVVTKSDTDTALTNTDAVNFKAELVDASTNQVVGTFDNINYNKTNLEKYASIDYEVDCSGITAGDYFLRLVTSVNTDAAYGLANIVSDNTTLAKKNFNKVNFTGSEIPITYELSNNFPNPFNPSTTIRYQIPQDGIVTLKIYDILGSEVATLVNEEKLAGKYEVNFNASSLASGVYIYKIQAGSFIDSKKMILLK